MQPKIYGASFNFLHTNKSSDKQY